jgi:hypothetical protein
VVEHPAEATVAGMLDVRKAESASACSALCARSVGGSTGWSMWAAPMRQRASCDPSTPHAFAIVEAVADASDRLVVPRRRALACCVPGGSLGRPVRAPAHTREQKPYAWTALKVLVPEPRGRSLRRSRRARYVDVRPLGASVNRYLDALSPKTCPNVKFAS